MRTASCQCGGFKAHVEGEPDAVNVCHCRDCQRRTGAHMSANAYFPKARVRLEGEWRLYARPASDGRQMRNCFCPTCGSTVCWTLDLFPERYGVAVGAFNDPAFPAPSRSVWEQSMYAWTTPPAGVERFPRSGYAQPE